MPKPEMADKLQSLSQKEKEIFCEAAFLTANWFREVWLLLCFDKLKLSHPRLLPCY